jgi:hypothetical protein
MYIYIFSPSFIGPIYFGNSTAMTGFTVCILLVLTHSLYSCCADLTLFFELPTRGGHITHSILYLSCLLFDSLSLLTDSLTLVMCSYLLHLFS